MFVDEFDAPTVEPIPGVDAPPTPQPEAATPGPVMVDGVDREPPAEAAAALDDPFPTFLEHNEGGLLLPAAQRCICAMCKRVTALMASGR